MITDFLSGESKGEFHELRVLDSNGTMQNVLDLLAASGGGGGGGGGTTYTATLPLSINGTVISIDLGSYSSTTQMTTAITNALASYTTTVGLNTILSGYTDTTGLNTILANYTDTTGLNTILANYTDTAGLNTILAGYTDTAGLNTILAGYTDTINLNTLLAAKQDTLTASTGIFLNQNTLSSYKLRYGTNSVPVGTTELRFDPMYDISEVVNFTTGEIEFNVGLFDGMSIANPTTYLESPTTNPNWHSGPPTQQGSTGWTDHGTHATAACNGAYMFDWQQDWITQAGAAGIAVGDTMTLEMKVKLVPGGATNLLIGLHQVPYTASVVSHTAASSGLNSSSWTTVRISAVALPQTGGGTRCMTYTGKVFGAYTNLVQTSGDIQIKDWSFSTGSHTTTFAHDVDINQSLDVTGDVTIHGALHQVSDQSIKDDIQDLSATDAEAVLESVNAATFVRKDLGEDPACDPRRVGFIANQLEDAILGYNWMNLVRRDENGLRSIAYDRLTAILWTGLKQTNARAKALETRLAAVEAKVAE